MWEVMSKINTNPIENKDDVEALYKKNWDEANRLLNKYNNAIEYNSATRNIEIKEKNWTITYLSILSNKDSSNPSIIIHISNGKNKDDRKWYIFNISKAWDILVEWDFLNKHIKASFFPATKFPDILKKIKDNLLQFEKYHEEKRRKEKEKEVEKIINEINY